MPYLLGSGEVRYRGRSGVVVRGERSKWISRQEVESLASKFRDAQFQYVLEHPRKTFDGAVGTLTFAADGSTKSVDSFDAMPNALQNLYESVEDFASEWVRGNARTLPSLRAEGFNWKGREGGELLARAARRGEADLIRDLVREGVPLDVFTEDNFWSGTPLEAAVANPSVQVLGVLIEAGASHDDQRSKDRALALAVASRHDEAAAMLRMYGARGR